MADDKQKILDRIAKLLALATSPNENEAALAADKAHALLVEHNLSLADVNEASALHGEEAYVEDGEYMTDSLPWRRNLAVAVAKLYFCGYYFKNVYENTNKRACGYIRHDQHVFIGTKGNAAVARVMFAYLNSNVDRLSKEGSLSQPMRSRSAYRTSFRFTCASRLAYRIKQRIDAARAGEAKSSTGTNLPVLASMYDKANDKVNEFLSGKGAVLKPSRALIAPSSEAGMRDGYAAGGKIGLDDQVSRDNQKQIA